jgi:hypothetical protein
VGAALAQLLRRRLRLRWEPLVRGGAPPLRLTMGAVQKSQTTSGLIASRLELFWIKLSINALATARSIPSIPKN